MQHLVNQLGSCRLEPSRCYAVVRCSTGDDMFTPLFSPVDFSVLQKAVDMALQEAGGRKLNLSVGDLAAKIHLLFSAGERDPQKLAAAVFAT
jgi:hypothetical protein